MIFIIFAGSNDNIKNLDEFDFHQIQQLILELASL